MTARPKVQIVTSDVLDVEVYLNGKMITSNMVGFQEAARELARALGADVEDAGEPDPQPYTYFIAYHAVPGPGVTNIGNMWWTGFRAIEGKADLDVVKAEIERQRPELGNVVITNFIFTDGPS